MGHSLPAGSRPVAVSRPSGAGLEIQNLTVRFQGLVAVDGLSLHAPLGQVTGLVGPNGAGKTTTFNFCSGLVAAEHGRLILNGRDLSSASPAKRARRGLGRTFQRVELFEALSVWDNVAMGREGGFAGAHLATHVVATPAQAEAVVRATADAIDLVEMRSMSSREVVTLSTAEKRMVELARCLAGGFSFLLLDEPSSGLDEEETRRFGEILTRVVAERGVGVLLVEHDMSLVSDVCTTLNALEFGRLIYSGDVAEGFESEAVRGAYLGTVEV